MTTWVKVKQNRIRLHDIKGKKYSETSRQSENKEELEIQCAKLTKILNLRFSNCLYRVKTLKGENSRCLERFSAQTCALFVSVLSVSPHHCLCPSICQLLWRVMTQMYAVLSDESCSSLFPLLLQRHDCHHCQFAV